MAGYAPCIHDAVGGLTMRFREIIEAKPVKPLTPAQSRRRTERESKAQAALADVQAAAAIRVNAARRKLADI
jgi:hypothetical protein